MKSIVETMSASSTKGLKTFMIDTWGGGTPLYLIAAENKERAFEMANQAWNDRYKSRMRNPINTVKEVKGFFADKETITDLYEIK